MFDRVSGFQFSGVAVGIKPDGRLDLGLAVATEPAVAAGMFTRNLVRAAPVEVAQQRVRAGKVKAILVNSGCANACTGVPGMQAALDLAATGYYVYLVEGSPAIGGTMAQLDKTFPTNECAM